MSKQINFRVYCNANKETIYIGFIDNVQVYKIERNQNQIWVAYNNSGVVIDKDQYRYDLFERLELKEKK